MKPEWLDQDEYPFESRFFDVEAGKLHYVDEGDSDHVIVLVHGNPTWSFSYRHLIKKLSNHYRCIAVDHLGFGLSEKPADWNYLPKSHAENLERLLNHLDIQSATVVVEDWGGPIGLSYALNYPEKIKSLVVMNSWCWPVNDDPYYRNFSGFMGGPIGRFLIKYFNFFARVVVKKAYGNKAKLTKSIHRHYTKPLGTPSDRKGSYVFPKQIIASTTWLEALWSRRHQIVDKPTLILWGKKDIAFRDQELAVWREAFSQAQVHTFDEVGHFVAEELVDEFPRLVEAFIQSTSS